jgi:hypothetical protein
MVCRNRLPTDIVGRDLVGGAGQPDFPYRVLLAVAHHCDDRQARKIGRIASDERGDKKGER